MWRDFHFVIFFNFVIFIPLHSHLILLYFIFFPVLYNPYIHLSYVNEYIRQILFKITKYKIKYSIKLVDIAYIGITIEFFKIFVSSVTTYYLSKHQYKDKVQQIAVKKIVQTIYAHSRITANIFQDIYLVYLTFYNKF